MSASAAVYSARSMQNRKKRGRPPSGDRPGERVVDYPQLSVRVPRATLRKLRAAATVERLSHSKVLANAVDRYLDAMPTDQRRLVEGLLRQGDRRLRAAVEAFQRGARHAIDHGPERRRSRGGAVRPIGDSPPRGMAGVGGTDRPGRARGGQASSSRRRTARRAPARHQRPRGLPADQVRSGDQARSKSCRSQPRCVRRSTSFTALKKAAPTCISPSRCRGERCSRSSSG